MGRFPPRLEQVKLQIFYFDSNFEKKNQNINKKIEVSHEFGTVL